MKEALTFDDVLLVPQKSDVSPSKVDTAVFLTAKIRLGIPLLSAAMDTVTENQMAIVLGQAGGLGIIHKNNSPKEQAAEIKKVKAKKLRASIENTTILAFIMFIVVIFSL